MYSFPYFKSKAWMKVWERDFQFFVILFPQPNKESYFPLSAYRSRAKNSSKLFVTVQVWMMAKNLGVHFLQHPSFVFIPFFSSSSFRTKLALWLQKNENILAAIFANPQGPNPIKLTSLINFDKCWICTIC